MSRIYTAITPEMEDRLEKYIESLPVEPQRNKIMQKALDKFLEGEGF